MVRRGLLTSPRLLKTACRLRVGWKRMKEREQGGPGQISIEIMMNLRASAYAYSRSYERDIMSRESREQSGSGSKLLKV